MKNTRIGLATALLVAVVASPREVRAADPDPWFGADKVDHFAVSGGVAATGYTVAAAFVEARGTALLIAGGATLVIGASKELWDLSGHGDPSWRDFTWDCIGNVAGLALGWGADLLIRGVSENQPLLIAPRVDRASAGLQLTFAF